MIPLTTSLCIIEPEVSPDMKERSTSHSYLVSSMRLALSNPPFLMINPTFAPLSRLLEFAQILRVPCQGVCVYTPDWPILYLQYVVDPHPDIYPPPHEDSSLIRDALFYERTQAKTRKMKGVENIEGRAGGGFVLVFVEAAKHQILGGDQLLVILCGFGTKSLEFRISFLSMTISGAASYAYSGSLLLTPLCYDDIHDVTPRVSALAGCDRLVSEPLVIEKYVVAMSPPIRRKYRDSVAFATGHKRLRIASGVTARSEFLLPCGRVESKRR
ncbi:hypothetical protein Tco_0173050 [Tanacetum coccineum]